MKIIFPGVASLVAIALTAQTAFAQFNGKLVYQIDRPDTRLVMTYYQTGTMGRMEAYNIKLNNGVTDTTTTHAQDTILWDFSAATETHLQYHTMRAFKTQYIANIEAAAMASRMKNQGSLNVTSAGTEVVNGYNCTHYVITSVSQLGTSTRDIWITGDLGPAPTVYVIGSYLYFPPGYPHLTKLTAAGANGIVVKSVSSFGRQNQGIISVMTLVSAQANTKYRPKMFQVPSAYNVVDETSLTFPTGKN